MKNLTKKQIAHLRSVRANLARGIAYLKNERIVGIAESIDPARALGSDYLVKNPDACAVCTDTPPGLRLLNKEIGSDIAGLYTALVALDAFLEIE